MEEEDIQDEGDASILDHARMVGDIETLDFSSDLVGILRQLVGVDLLRENEIFFLPQPGESYRRKRHGKSKLYAARSSSGDFATLGFQNPAVTPRGPKARKESPSPSLAMLGAESPVSPGSTDWDDRNSDQYSPSTASYSDGEMVKPNNSDPRSKRRKRISAKRNGVHSSENMPPPSSGVQSTKTSTKHGQKARRNKRLSIDAHAYKPELEARETSVDHDSEATKGRRKQTGKRGIKRNRTSELVDIDGASEQPTAKRLRGRLSTSLNK
jgi:hypothetical protein